jgi:ferredoxin
MTQMGIEFHCDTPIDDTAALRAQYDALVLACSLSRPPLKGAARELSSEPEDVPPAPFLAEEHRQYIRAIASGKQAAEAAHRVLLPNAAPRTGKPYDANLGRIRPDHINAYAAARIAPESLARPRQPEQAPEEAQRCFQCDCRAPVSCKLRQYATEYGAEPRVYAGAERLPIEGIRRHGDVVYESGKCIRCGLCVEITRAAGEELGLTFVGRGFNIQISVPFNGPLESALKNCAQACVEACPTGALAFGNREERTP